MASVSFVDALKQRYGFSSSSGDDPTAGAEEPLGSAFVNDAKWQFVGVQHTREKQKRHDRLTLVVLRNCGINVAMHESTAARAGDDDSSMINEVQEANMIRLEELDLSENTALSLAEVGKLVPYLPRLTTLQLCDIPHLLQTKALATTAALSSSQLSKLVLNNTSFRSLAQLRALVEVPQLRELHLDSNKLTSLDVAAPPLTPQDTAKEMDTNDSAASRAATSTVVFPHVTTLSLAHNHLSDWQSIGATIERVFPALTQLYLTDNKMVDLLLAEDLVARAAAGDALAAEREEGGVLRPYGYLHRLTLLCVKDNATLRNPGTVDGVRILCPHLITFRITYSMLLPAWNDTNSRMYVVAALPTVTLLNRGTVRPKERLDSELLYVQRGLLQRQIERQMRDGDIERTDAAATSVPSERITYPLLDVLQEKHKEVVLSILREADTAMTTDANYLLINATLFFVNGYAASSATSASSSPAMATHTQKIPNTLTVAKLKALIHKIFQINPVNQRLSYRRCDDGASGSPETLGNEQQTLMDCGVSDGSIIYVEDASLR